MGNIKSPQVIRREALATGEGTTDGVHAYGTMPGTEPVYDLASLMRVLEQDRIVQSIGTFIVNNGLEFDGASNIQHDWEVEQSAGSITAFLGLIGDAAALSVHSEGSAEGIKFESELDMTVDIVELSLLAPGRPGIAKLIVVEKSFPLVTVALGKFDFYDGQDSSRIVPKVLRVSALQLADFGGLPLVPAELAAILA